MAIKSNMRCIETDKASLKESKNVMIKSNMRCIET